MVGLALAGLTAAYAIQPPEGRRPQEKQGELEGPKNRLKLKPRVLLQAQGASYSVDELGGDSLSRQEGTLRRARIGFNASLGRRIEASFVYDFAHSGGEEKGRINAAWIQYRAGKLLALRGGAFAPWQGLEGSSAETLFMERSAPSSLYRGLVGGDARIGGALIAESQRWSLTASVTGDSINRSNATGQLGAGVRGTYLLVSRGKVKVHVGASVSLILQSPHETGARRLRFADNPEAHLAMPRLIDTGTIPARAATSANFEAAVQKGPVEAQGEYFRALPKDCGGACKNVHLSGWYVQAAWTLTGEARRYRSGGFESPLPKAPFGREAHGFGAMELGLRYSRLDMENDAPQAPGSSIGGRQEGLGFQANWYLTSAMRLSASIQRVHGERQVPGGSDPFHLRAILLRAQYAV
ncbi:MAG: OprO/OprP family phosphate-selective porin [Sphingomicrobium sp.]